MFLVIFVRNLRKYKLQCIFFMRFNSRNKNCILRPWGVILAFGSGDNLHAICSILYFLPWCVYTICLPGEAENATFAIERRERKWYFRPARQKKLLVSPYMTTRYTRSPIHFSCKKVLF